MNFCTNIPKMGERGGEEEKEEEAEEEEKNVTLHWPGIEPGPPAWQARILPLNHQCLAERRSHYFII